MNGFEIIGLVVVSVTVVAVALWAAGIVQITLELPKDKKD